MKGIFVDPTNRTATAQTGLTWGEFDRETALYGLATTGGLISTTGIAGLTLGGGVGWLMGRCGLVCDNTLSYDIVLASGELIRASASEHPDLFWALKGAGGNFGAVTSITYRMYPITTVISGMILHPLADARDVLRFYRDFVMSGLPDELIVYCRRTLHARRQSRGRAHSRMVWRHRGRRARPRTASKIRLPNRRPDRDHALSGHAENARWRRSLRAAQLLEEPLPARPSR
jgi:hypothetical protein